MPGEDMERGEGESDVVGGNGKESCFAKEIIKS